MSLVDSDGNNAAKPLVNSLEETVYQPFRIPKTGCTKCLECFFPCCTNDDEFGGKLSLHNSLVTTKRKFNDWKLLDKEEKKERIKYLWK